MLLKADSLQLALCAMGTLVMLQCLPYRRTR